MYDWTDETIAKSLSGQSAFPLQEILRGSLYYPASGFDGSPVRHANALKVNSFIHVDTFATEHDLDAVMAHNAFRGYSIFGQRILTLNDLTPNGWKPEIPRELEEHLRKPYVNAMRMANANPGTSFARWTVFKRNPELSDDHGPASFSLLHIRGEGVATYQALYSGERILPKIVAIVRPGTGFGGNYSIFEEFLYGVMKMHPLGMPPELLEWHYRDRADRITSAPWIEMYPERLLGPLTKDGEPDFALSLYARANSYEDNKEGEMYICFVIEESHIVNEEAQGFPNQEVIVQARVVSSNLESATQDIEGKKVMFAVRSENEAKCKAIARAIVDIYNRWIVDIQDHKAQNGNNIRPHGDWAPNVDQNPPQNAEYIYVYATPDHPNGLNLNNVFYIGRGKNGRWLDHVDAAHRNRARAEDINALDFLKIKKINESFQQLGMADAPPREKREWARLNMVRRIAHFYGDYAKERCDAVENFLINYWIGVFDLTNENRGYSNFEKNDFEWITYPRAILDTRPWTDIVRIFCNGQAVKQGPANQLLAQEINSLFLRGAWNWTPTQVLNSANSTTRLEPMLPEFTTNNTDVFFEYRLLKENINYLTLHLKNEKSGTGVCINLRRVDRNETLESFVAKIRETFFSGDRELLWDRGRYIKNKRNDPYFKPCANLGNGKQEVNFDLRNLANSSKVKTGAPLLQGSPDQRVTLNQALQMIVDLV